MKTSEKKRLAGIRRRAKREAKERAIIEAQVEAKRLQSDAESWRHYMNRPKEPTLKDRLEEHLMAIMSRPPVFESYSTADVPRGCRCTVIIPNGPVVTAVAAARVGDGYMEIHGLERAAHAKAIAKAVVELEQSRTNYGRIIGSASGETMPQKLQYEWRAVDGAAKQELRHE